MEPSEKIKLYDKGVDFKGNDSMYKALVEYRTGDMFAPHVAQTEALMLLAADFVKSIETGSTPAADAVSGLNVIRLLEAADVSLKAGGSVVPLNGAEVCFRVCKQQFFAHPTGPSGGAERYEIGERTRALWKCINA
jgi:hypothetical protein